MGLLLPKHARRSFYVVRAFNVEITSVKEVVKDPKMGMIRMQWWKETITAAYQVILTFISSFYATTLHLEPSM
jgi:phytoene/squalene synthetase